VKKSRGVAGYREVTPYGGSLLIGVKKSDGHRGYREVTPYGVTESLDIAVLSRGHSYGVTESLDIAVLSRGHSYGVTESLGISRCYREVTPTKWPRPLT
jgi:hypothetical protein